MGVSDRVGDALGRAVDQRMLREVLAHEIRPQHMAIIMDGNRRFAFSNRLTSGVGHRIGKAKLEEVLDWVLELNIPWFTVYALSTENLKRPKDELDALFDLYIEGLNDIAEDPRIHANHVRVQIIGRRDLLPARVIEAIDHAELRTAGYDRFVFSVCLAYGSREEILDAIRAIAEDHAKGDLPLEAINEAAVSDRLYTADMPDPDLVRGVNTWACATVAKATRTPASRWTRASAEATRCCSFNASIRPTSGRGAVRAASWTWAKPRKREPCGNLRKKPASEGRIHACSW